MEFNNSFREKKTNNKNMPKFSNGFVILSQNSAIMHGSFSINDKRFKLGSRGSQAIPCCITAIVIDRLMNNAEWNSELVDRVLIYGDKIFRISRTKNRVHADAYMTTSMVYPEFFIEDYKCSICATENIVSGNLFTENSNCPDLVNGIKDFFTSYEAGILTTQHTPVAIWRNENNDFLYFNPSPCAKDGSKCSVGVACIMKFKCLNSMLDLILSYLNKKCDSKYSIDKINILNITLVKRNNIQLSDKTNNETKTNCPTSQEPSVTKMLKIRRVPVKETISNSNITQNVEQLSDTQNLFGITNTHIDVRVNIPSIFKQISDNAWILHGWTHENSEMYKGKGAQNIANCLMSIGIRKFNPVRTWLRETLDKILNLGDLVYAQFKINNSHLKEITADDFNDTKFEIENQKLIAHVDILTIIGLLSSRTPHVLDLKSAVKQFFLHNDSGIIETSIMAVAIWMEHEYYYMFDPRQSDQNGFRVIEEKKKKDNAAGKEKKINGKCCVIRFSDVNALTSHFIQNIPIGKKNERFLIKNIEIVDDMPGTQPWHNFEPGESKETWILQGNVISDTQIMDNKNRATAISIVSLVFAKKIPLSEWTKETVDNIIHEGNEYYNWCFSTEQEDKYFDFLNFKYILYVSNQKVNLQLEEAIVVGNIVVSMDNRYLSLEEGINRFFENYQFGIVELNDMVFAIWKELDLKDTSKQTYYLFSVNSKNQNNLEKKEPSSSVIKVVNIREMAKIIEKNIEYGLASDTPFIIHNVNILSIGNSMTNEEIESEKKFIFKPELYQYVSINEKKACLNGNINQGNEIVFDPKTRNKQQAANALLALAMKNIHNPHLWSKQVIDDILKLGDKITSENIKNLPEPEGETVRTWLLPKEIQNEFNLGINHISCEIQEDFVSGKLNDLTKILEEYFVEKTMGIFKLESTIMPIWKQGSVFFTMDPKGRDNLGIPKENDGTAAVLWFTDISDLASDLAITAGNNTNVDFSIDSVETNYESKLTDQEESQQILSTDEMWYGFTKESNGVWYITGIIDFTNERFSEENQRKQSAAIAIMAIVFSKIYNPRRWSAEVLDEVIVAGDVLHTNCKTRLENKEILRVGQIMTEFFLFDRRINLCINDCVQSGLKIQDALSAIDSFFHKYPSGVLNINGEMNLAIWKFDDFYYYLLPTSRLMRFAELTDLLNHLSINFNIVDYEIAAVDVINWNKLPPWTFDPSPNVRPSTLPPLNAFKRLQGTARALLQNNSNQIPTFILEKIQNQQSAANCIVALGMAIVKNPVTWTRNTLDEILSIGNKLYQESLKSCPGKEKLRPKDIIRVFYLGRNILTVDVSNPVISGQVSIPPPEPETKEKKQKTKKKPERKKKKGKVKREPPVPPPLILLEDGIKQFFETNNAGVLVIDRSMIAIWKQLGVYFIHVSYAWNTEDVNDNFSSSCAAWFACLEPFYNFIYTNLKDDEKYTMYQIHRVLFKTTAIKSLPSSVDLSICETSTMSTVSTSKVKNITLSGIKTLNTFNNNYKKLSILSGTRNMKDIMFDPKNRGLQSTAIAAVAIVVGSIHVPSTWTSDIIDAILMYGDLLHTDSCKLLGISSRNLSPCELHNVFIVGDFRAHIHIHPYTMTGLLDPFDVAETLLFFFKNNTCGILHVNSVAMAVSQHFGKFYLFNPSRHTENLNNDETASIMKFSNITNVAHEFVTNCKNSKLNVYTLNSVSILSLHSIVNTKKSYLLECEI